ncbi:hypothetical protein QWY86_10025 [Pedobacter aquatilis]|uniref:hypothetical protein n=1 Tax=Pedobacter aquatilis TaxID=351343 RepID=UPI0025B4E978|nr:hypothetical protein [Pedobacter aquatilis]MDN3587005.1 hypothetical protein [Pedobacter aquatilis]
MKAPVVIIKQLPANGMAIFPFILVKRKADKNNAALINHEKIHLRQQLELLILPFYALYLFNYLINLLVYKKHHLAYMKIVFEQEAYDNEDDLGYLKSNKWFGWIKNVKALKLP